MMKLYSKIKEVETFAKDNKIEKHNEPSHTIDHDLIV